MADEYDEEEVVEAPAFEPTGKTPLGWMREKASKASKAAQSGYQNLGDMVGAGNRPAEPNFISKTFNYLKDNAPVDTHQNHGGAPGAQGGASSTTADNIADQVRGTTKPGEAPKPVTVGQGIDVQGKAREAKANTPSPTMTPSIGEQDATYRNAMGLNSPDTAPTRLPSTDTGTPQGFGGYGNATGAAATGRTTGDGSSNPNSPNFRPVGLGGVPIQSAGEWMQQRAGERAALMERRRFSNAKDDARRSKEAGDKARKKALSAAKRDLPIGMNKKQKAAAMIALHKAYMTGSTSADTTAAEIAGEQAQAALGAGVNIANQARQSNDARLAAEADRAAAARTSRIAANKAAMDQSKGDREYSLQADKFRLDRDNKQATIDSRDRDYRLEVGKQARADRKDIREQATQLGDIGYQSPTAETQQEAFQSNLRQQNLNRAQEALNAGKSPEYIKQYFGIDVTRG